MRRRRTLAALAIAVGLIVSPATGPLAQDAEPGDWIGPFSEEGAFDSAPPSTPEESMRYPTASSAVVLPSGKILFWNGLQDLEDSEYPLLIDAARTAGRSQSRVLDLSGSEPVWTTPTPDDGGSDDMFCADQRLLADGRVIVAGGTQWRFDPVDLREEAPALTGAFEDATGLPAPGGVSELFGSNATRFFDHRTDSWTVGESMHFGRWYPTLVTLPDGKLFVASGVEKLIANNKGLNVHETEIFDPADGNWTQTGEQGSTTLPLFARMHLLPSGKVFYVGAGQMWSPAGAALDQALWNVQKAYDPYDPDATWTTTGIGTLGARSGALSVMLPLRPDADGNYPSEAKILVAGGTLGTSPGSYVANNLTEIITVRETEAGTESHSDVVAPLNNPRWYSSGVLLPDGTVVAVNGADRDEVVQPGGEGPVRQPELYDPATDTWTSLASGRRDRTYHNSALLLADGSVLVGGHAPINAGYGPKGDGANDDTGLLANNLKDPSFEILRPPYLDRGPRPEVTHAYAGMGWTSTSGAAFPVNVNDNGGNNADKVVLVRLPSTTHVTDADMRAVELDFTRVGTNQLHVTPPPDGNIAPPGFYYLFVLSADGVPSKARVVKVGAEPDVSGIAPAPMGQ